jgi:WD40 repeat protein
MSQQRIVTPPNKELDPIASIRGHPSAVSSLCFLDQYLKVAYNDEEAFRCEANENEDFFLDIPTSSNCVGFTSLPLLLASCDISGNAFLWNVQTRRKVAQFGLDRREKVCRQPDLQNKFLSSCCDPGLSLRRLMPSSRQSTVDNDISFGGSPSQHYFLYHTRGREGIVSIFNPETLPGICSSGSEDNQQVQQLQSIASSTIFQVKTYSSTFCAASPCRGNSNLIVTPTSEDCVAEVYDIRASSEGESSAALVIHGAGRPGSTSRNRSHKMDNTIKEHGMLTSLSMAITAKEGIPIVACGMESGDIYFHDCRMLRPGQQPLLSVPYAASKITTNIRSISVSRDPILSIDLFESYLSPKHDSSPSDSIIAICGSAGDAADMNALIPIPDDRSTGAIVKTFFNGYDHQKSHNEEIDVQNQQQKTMIQILSRFQTCNIGDNAVGGKPGISCCRFRDDGKLFAVGGWDHRARIFTRRGRPLAILKGHEKTVSAVDWSPNMANPSSTDRLFSTGSSDGKILLWNLSFNQ